jgi:DDE superfamily endonuclease
MRMSIRRFTRLTNAFSKKLENHTLSVVLHYMHYNFCQIHKSLRVTPAMAAGVTDRVWTMLVLIHVFLDNARYHHAKLIQEWLAQPGRRIKLHFIPAYCPHLNPIERLWGVMHRHVTHNKSYATFVQFADATLGFLRDKVLKNWARFRDSVTDNFRVISPRNFRVMT